MAELKNRYDFVLLFDVKDGNPNGDPDAGNLPRLDPETGQGLVTDVCLKRKVRNYVLLTKGNESGFDIFVKEKAILNVMIAEALKKQGSSKTAEAREPMCKDFFDIRTFGAVLTNKSQAEQVRGPVQMTFARSIDRVVVLEHSITRCAVTDAKDAEKQRTMGRKNTVPYGLYVGYGFVSPSLAKQTGFSEEDLELFWEALENMFEHDRSAARGMMTTCKLIVFKHSSALGSAPAHRLFERVKVTKADPDKVTPPRDFSDYVVTIDKDALPEGVEVIERV